MGFQKRVISAVLAVIMLCSLSVSSALAEDLNKKQNNDEVTISFTCENR